MASPGHKLVVMGVAGAGKSTIAQAIARDLDWVLVEGDEHHLPESKAKMRAGIPLGDADREPWLDLLGDLLARSAGGVVLTCSALKRAYRDRLRARAPGLRVVYAEIDRASAQERAAARLSHFFPASLVTSQFEALEPPTGEPGVLAVSALWPLEEQVRAVRAWLDAKEGEAA